MLLFLLQCASTGSLVGSTLPSAWLTNGRFTREMNCTLGG